MDFTMPEATSQQAKISRSLPLRPDNTKASRTNWVHRKEIEDESSFWVDLGETDKVRDLAVKCLEDCIHQQAKAAVSTRSA